MTIVHRLKIATAALGLSAVVACTLVWGEPSEGKKPLGNGLNPSGVKLGDQFDVATRFSRPVLAYDTQAGETLFALQLKPNLPPAAARPRDLLLMVDTSASQAGKYLTAAREIAAAIVADASPTDRVSLWTINTPKATRRIGKELADAKSPGVQTALENLKQEYASGAVDLKSGIEKAVGDFDKRIERQQIIVYLGDGDSALDNLTEKARYDLAAKLRDLRIQFFPVPLGSRIHAKNIHGLATGTGGAVVRADEKDPKNPQKAAQALVERLNKAVSTPVLMPTEFQPAFAGEFFPTRLPPLRPDAPTLIVGRFEKDKAPKELKGTIKGRIGKDEVTIQFQEAIPVASVENFFLNSMVSQWKESSMKDAPALLRADRTLALAFEQGRLNRDEYLTQFNWALGVNQVEAAKNLVEAAEKIDPNHPEVRAGVKVIDKLRSGKLTLEQLKAAIGQREGVRFEKQADGKVVPVRFNLEEISKQDPELPAPKADNQPGADARDLLKQEAARRAIEEQKVRLAVEESLSRSRDQLRNFDPKAAKDLLIPQRDSVKGNPDISEATRTKLLRQIDDLLTEIGSRGEALIRRKAEENEAIARAKQKVVNVADFESREEQTKIRIKNFNSLMAQARYEDAYREALVMQQERVNRGEPTPIETQAVYQIGQAATNLREMRELTRIREDRFLLTMMQVEKSHIPYPDEPPVHFPPSRVWRDLLQLRKRYANTSFDGDIPARAAKRMQFLQSALDNPIPEIAAQEFPLNLLLTSIEDFASPPGSDKDPSRRVKILVDEKAFKAESGGMFELEKAQVKFNTKLVGVSLGTALRLICEQIDGSYWVRRDYIEIVPASMAIREKVIRVFPVEDLVVPIPNSVNTQALAQSLAILGATFSLGGGFTGQPIAGAFGGGQGFQFFGGNNAQNQGQQNAVGQLFQGAGGGNNNLGAGGGIAGFGGGQLGQFGNLGGQFGFQGGDQSTLLVQLINEVVARGEWANAPGLIGGGGGGGGMDPDNMGGGAILPPDMLNSLGYYPPARALVIRGTSRMHRSQNNRLTLKKPDMGVNFNPGVVKNVAENKPAQVVKVPEPKREPIAKDTNPEKIYQDLLAKGLTDAGEIIAACEFMVACREFKHATELLKASLRNGVTAEPWAQEALALALEGSQGDIEEIERAKVSPVDLEPKSPLAYLKVAKAYGEMGDPDRALVFNKQAARIEPNMPEPYLNALVLATDAKASPETVTDVWAAQHLLGRDWITDSTEHHLRAREHLKNLSVKLTNANQPEALQKVQRVIESDKRRDLVIQLLWTGKADLDLKVTEAIGTTCSSTNRQTAAGGTLLCDDFTQKDDAHSETYAAAEAFNGIYRVSINRVWGAPLGDKATIKVIRHQGTKDEQVEIHTLNLKQPDSMVSISMEGGRRTALATVPPPGFAMDNPTKFTRERDVIQRLKAMTDAAPGSMVGMAGGAGSPTKAASGDGLVGQDNLLTDINLQATLPSAVPNGIDMRQQTTMTRDGKLQVRMAPVFETANTAKHGKQLKFDLIPGAE